jgi:hypothetical protein
LLSDTAVEKRRVPETVFDPSHTLTVKRRRTEAASSGGGPQQGLEGENAESSSSMPSNPPVDSVGKRKSVFVSGTAPDDDIDRFRDSRGTGPSCVSFIQENKL